MIKRHKIPTIIGIIFLLLGTFGGVFFLRKIQLFKIGASTTATPKDVRVSNLSDISATISWVTEDATADFISWGETQKNLGNVEKESETDQKFFTHSITLTGLKPGITYSYDINSEGTNFDNNGVAWQFTTGQALSENQSSIPVSGSVISASGQPSKRAIIYVNVGGYLLSTLTSDSGNFVLQLGQVRTPDLSSYPQINMTTTLLEVSVTTQDGQTASAQIFPQSANPIPTLILGQVEDYRNLQPVADGQNPNADLTLPAGATEESKFDISAPSGTTKSTSVILESLNQGETVTSTEPQFFGKGPAGETITITIHSDQQISGKVQIPKSGSWSYSVPTTLSEGPHSITISWVDATGILRTLTRDFVVQAGEMPAFVATPSGSTPSPTPTVRPTPTPKLTPTPTPTPSRSPTLSPVPTVTAKPEPTPSIVPESLPATGSLTPTLLLSIMGLVIMAFSFAVWKMSEN